MDNFFKKNFTVVDIPALEPGIEKESLNFFLGSCFAENLFKYYEQNYIDCLFSPFGNIYNPLSLSAALNKLCGSDRIGENEIFLHRELWRHSDFSTELCSTDKAAFLDSINKALTGARHYLEKCHYLYLTLGTSFIYRDIKNHMVVNNCHKRPGRDFKRENASISVMRAEMTSALNKVKEINPAIQIIMTLSPVRHLRDSAEENSLSKARLRCLIDELSQDIDLWYFPAYEIQLDQLRDYRWYKEDLTHPSEMAVSYLMNRFVERAANSDFKEYVSDIKKLNSMLHHRILHETDESRTFRKKTNEKILDLINRYPSMTELKKKYNSQISGNH